MGWAVVSVGTCFYCHSRGLSVADSTGASRGPQLPHLDMGVTQVGVLQSVLRGPTANLWRVYDVSYYPTLHERRDG